jgi:CMP-N-acetylneuraminic acid synthetase
MKAHSARIPNKNFRMFLDKPLFRWVLETLLSITEIDLVVINTDARDILAKHGLRNSSRVLIRDRKSEICGDFISMNRVLADDIAEIVSETYLMTHTTNPLISASTIRRAVHQYRVATAADEADSLFSVNRFQARFYRTDGSPVNHDPKNLVRTQDLEPWFEENSNLYVFSRTSFATTGARIGKRPLLFETPPLESADIDDRNGWELAELIACARQKEISHSSQNV